MKTKQIVEMKTGKVTHAAYDYAVARLNAIGFKVKKENEVNPVLLDRLSTYIDEYERGQAHGQQKAKTNFR